MTKQLKRATKIMLIRHAEKPPKDGLPYGVMRTGEHSKESLQVRGWQRAGALASLLAPGDNHFERSSLAKPQFLYASKPLRRKGSQRPIETITPLAEKLGIHIHSDYARFEFASMVDHAFRRRGVVLICWQREYIPQIAALILGQLDVAPHTWPENRFDLIWVFDLNRSATKYKFRQVPQKLLRGDLLTPIT